MTSSVETLQVQPPFDWEGLLSFFAPRAIPGVEAVEQGVLRRSFRKSGKTGVLEIRRGQLGGDLELEVWGLPAATGGAATAGAAAGAAGAGVGGGLAGTTIAGIVIASGAGLAGTLAYVEANQNSEGISK